MCMCSMIWEPAPETKVYAKWQRNRCQNEASWVAKSFKIYQKSAKVRSKIYEHRSMKPSWGDFGRIWCYLGCKLEVLGLSWRQIWGSWADLGSKMGVWGSILAPKWKPKSMKIVPQSDPKSDHLFDNFWDRLLERFGANLAPTWLPKHSQNEAKLVPKSTLVGMLI